MRKALRGCAIIVVTFLCGCVQLSETELPAHGVRGLRYECRQEMLVRGIKRELSSPGYDYINLYPAPGIGGPEVVYLGTLPAGTVIEIDGVLQRGSALLSRMLYRIKVIGPLAERFAKEDVRLRTWKQLYAGRDKWNQPILNPELFRAVQ